MMMQMVASFAELERAIVRERTSAGVAAALAELRVGGRRKRLGPAERSETAEGVNTDRKSGAALQPQCTGRVRHRRPTPNRLGLECSFGQHPDPRGRSVFSVCHPMRSAHCLSVPPFCPLELIHRCHYPRPYPAPLDVASRGQLA